MFGGDDGVSLPIIYLDACALTEWLVGPLRGGSGPLNGANFLPNDVPVPVLFIEFAPIIVVGTLGPITPLLPFPFPFPFPFPLPLPLGGVVGPVAEINATLAPGDAEGEAEDDEETEEEESFSSEFDRDDGCFSNGSC